MMEYVIEGVMVVMLLVVMWIISKGREKWDE